MLSFIKNAFYVFSQAKCRYVWTTITEEERMHWGSHLMSESWVAQLGYPALASCSSLGGAHPSPEGIKDTGAARSAWYTCDVISSQGNTSWWVSLHSTREQQHESPQIDLYTHMTPCKELCLALECSAALPPCCPVCFVLMYVLFFALLSSADIHVISTIPVVKQ